MIQLQNVTLGYKSRVLLDNISAIMSSGELIALLGRNGTGKSTLLQSISGLHEMLKGTVLLNEKDLKYIKPEDLAQTISFVNTERIRISNLCCWDVVALGRAPYTNWIGRMHQQDVKIVMHSLELVGMKTYANQTMDQMSDGECQRIMIARALAQDTPIIILDEPTSFLDLPNRYELCTLLQNLAHNERKCILFSTHELDIALTMCDSIALIDTPHMYFLPTRMMIESGHIERLFSNSSVTFDPNNCAVKIKK